MKQRDVTQLAYRNAAAMVRDADLQVLFGDDFLDSEQATDEQMTRAQEQVVERLERLGSNP